MPDVALTVAEVSECQADLEAKGFDAEDLAAAAQIGFTPDEKAAFRQGRLDLQPQDAEGGLRPNTRQAVEALRSLGVELMMMPPEDAGAPIGGI